MTTEKAKKQFKKRFCEPLPPGLLGVVCLYYIAGKKQEDWRELFVDYFGRINALPYVCKDKTHVPDYDWVDKKIEYYKEITKKRFNL
jgi:hypothetical protein